MFLAIERVSERKNESVSERLSRGIGTARISKNLAAWILVNSLCSLCIQVGRRTKMRPGGLPGGSGQPESVKTWPVESLSTPCVAYVLKWPGGPKRCQVIFQGESGQRGSVKTWPPESLSIPCVAYVLKWVGGSKRSQVVFQGGRDSQNQ